MKLYHISENIYENIETFNPRIPLSILKEEDSSINRVCIAKSIQDCLSAINYHISVNYMFNELEENESYVGNRIVRVYEFDINEKDENLLNYNQISKYVPDSIQTKEYWYLKPLTPVKSYLINIINYDLLDNDSNILTDLEYEVIEDLNIIPQVVNISVFTEEDKNNLAEMVDLFNSQTLINGNINDKIAKFDLKNFPLNKESYKKTFENKFNWFKCEITFNIN